MRIVRIILKGDVCPKITITNGKKQNDFLNFPFEKGKIVAGNRREIGKNEACNDCNEAYWK